MASEKNNVNFGGKTTRNLVRPTKNKKDRKSDYSILAHGVGYTAAAPLDRLAILRQVRSASIVNYMGTIQALKYIQRTEGFQGLFKGNGTNSARFFTYFAVKFLSYEQAYRGLSWFHRQQSGNEDAKHIHLLRFGSLVCVTFIARSATYPLDLVQGRLTVQTGKSPYKYRGMFHALSTVLREEGPRALYRGYLPSVLHSVVNVGLNIVLYETVYRRLLDVTAMRVTMAKEFQLHNDPKMRGNQIRLVKNNKFNAQQQKVIDEARLRLYHRLAWVDAFAVTVAYTVAYPFDVIHRRMQMVGWKNASSIVTGDVKNKATFEYTGMVDAFRRTVRNEGFGALYKGWVTSLVKVGPSLAATVVAHRVLNDMLGVEVNIKTSVTGPP